MTTVLRGAAFLCLLMGASIPYAALPQTAPNDVPEKLKAPAGEQLILEAHATGWQIYVCQAGADQKFAWVDSVAPTDRNRAFRQRNSHSRDNNSAPAHERRSAASAGLLRCIS